MAEPVSLLPGFVADPNMPVPKSKPMNPYSLPEEYENIPLNEIYPEKFPREKFEKLVKVIKQQESGNQHYNKEGLVKIGKAGEVGLMQIKPLGNLGGGLKGIRRPVLEDKELNERIGRIYLTHILEDPIINYDIPSAIMAWNRGLGKHKKWVAKGRNKEELPSWTKNYLKAAEKVFPKSFVQKKEEIVPTPVVKTTKLSFEKALNSAFPEAEAIRELIKKANPKNVSVYQKILEDSINLDSFDAKEARRKIAEKVFKDKETAEYYMNRVWRTDEEWPPKPIEKKEGGFVSA